MSQWIVSIFVAALAGVLSLFLAGAIANWCVDWYRISSREGQSGYFVVLIALLGGLGGVVIGLISARVALSMWGGGFLRELVCAAVVITLIAGVAAGLCRLLADVPPELHGQKLNLEVEFRFPMAEPQVAMPTAAGDWAVELSSISGGTRRDYRTGTIAHDSARLEEHRWILPTSTPLFTERGQRAISLRSGQDEVGGFGFIVPLPRRPGEVYESWSQWLPLQQADGQPWPATKMSYRFRISKIVEPRS